MALASAAAAGAELEASLQSLQSLKPPGVTKSKVASITAFCVDNVKWESVIAQKIYLHFKKTAGTHKLGVLYVVDSVARQWVVKAAGAGQQLAGSAAPEGTFASGFYKLSEFLPLLMNDLVQSAPDDQKEKIFKLIDIWERGEVFSSEVLSDFKARLNARAPQTPRNVTAPAAIPKTPTSTIEATRQHAPEALPQSPAKPSVATQHIPLIPAQGAQEPTAPSSSHTQQPSPEEVLANITPDQARALEAVIPAHIASDPEALAKHLQLLQQLVSLGVPQEQWPAVIAAVQDQAAQQNSSGQRSSHQPTTSYQTMQPAASEYTSQLSQSEMRQRSRSRSPPRRRPSPVYGKYENPSVYRSRSPLRSDSPGLQADKIMLTGPKWTDYDPSLKEGSIKVLSRTLFAGGTTLPEVELREIFSRFGEVQTVITNPDKRQAFVKMCTRAGAVAAKEGMEKLKDPTITSKIRSTRWGVGFGPRECCNFATGISVIPIEKLTEADHRWVLTAEYGGTGGKPLETGLVMEEPDIEIGAGVSSKAMSRRAADEPKISGNNPTVGRTSGGNQRGQRRPEVPQRPVQQEPSRRPQHYDANGIGVPPPVPGFGFQFPTTPATSMGQGMPPYA